MNKIWKFFRGSGRALAFIFIASVIWLLFDMAALRLSFNEVNTRVLKEDFIQRERFKVLRDQGIVPPKSTGQQTQIPTRIYRKEKYKRTEEKWGKADNSDQPKVGKELFKGAERGSPTSWVGLNKVVVPLKRDPGHPLSPKPSLPMQERQGGNRVKIGNLSRVASKNYTVFHIPQQTPSATALAPGNAAVKLSNKFPPGKNLSPLGGKLTTASKHHTVGDLKMGATLKYPPPELNRELQMEGVVKQSPPALSVPRAEKTMFPKESQAQLKGRNQHEHIARKNWTFPVMELTANPDHLQTFSAKETGLGLHLKEDRTREGHEKVHNDSESPIVIVTKEQLETNIAGLPNSKAYFKVTLTEISEKIRENAAPRNKSEEALPLNISPEAARFQTRQTFVQGAALTRAHLETENLSREQNQSHKNIYSPQDPRMHKVLTLDVTLSPRDPKAPGQFGHAAVVPAEKQERAKKRWKEGNFNVYLSDLIPVDRAIEDTRPDGCAEQLVHNDLPTTTIIMCFVDEVWSTLLRSIHSVLNRSPPHLIQEIILVDDFSTKEHLKDNLDKYMAQFPKVRVLHLKERHGLIRARLAGAEIATGDVLTFLDSHVECNVGWLEPLLERVRLHRKKVACPVIEVISDKDLSYQTVDNFQRGIFTWPMNFGWKSIPPEVIEKNKMKETDIIRCPVMAGGLFSIDKKYFYELGTYDPGLDVWGGENMEISFKVWMCGGEIEIVPCSRVGHIFRNDNPYSFPKDRVKTVERNLVRVAEVWLDEYKDLFYGHGLHLLERRSDIGNLTQQKELRKKLQCKSFKWYLENVFSDLEAPVVRASGVLINAALGKCISLGNDTVVMEDCDLNSKMQQFNYTWLRFIKHEDLCLAPLSASEIMGLSPCDNRNKGLKWLHKSLVALRPELMDHIVVANIKKPTCWEANHNHNTLRMTACDSMNPYQKWKFEKYYVD
ncbi:polypeptide N-acetylgalactosaminyltransferase 5 [Ornithorhynchus anatinus]|uniref:Polypeptide N-acetylgalactosaminyltransferase n=1 Tax=Ornithorhynchus anatinus TaxID=9258 RepID=F6WTJ5_ORNAN|nr:polypeptide N-acetylgalactosaminyltransferase 5 [Ornithorhynchus anatinus]